MKDFDQMYRDSKSFLKEAKQRIIINNGNPKILQSNLEEMYKHLRSSVLNFYDEKRETIDSYFDILIDILIRIENMYIPQNLFIIPSEPSFVFSEKISNKPKSSNVEKILDWLVYRVRQKYANISVLHKDTTVQYSSFENECTNMSQVINSICEEFNIPCQIIRINPGFEKDARLYKNCNFHDICIVTLNGEDYLIDCTYRQFFMIKNCSLERIGIPFVAGTTPGAFMTLTPNRLELAQKILTRGWIKLTPDNIKNYFDGFALSYRNGHYYDETGDYSFTTSYTPQNYLDFLEGTDSQLKHESEKVLSFQTSISFYNSNKIKS